MSDRKLTILLCLPSLILGFIGSTAALGRSTPTIPVASIEENSEIESEAISDDIIETAQIPEEIYEVKEAESPANNFNVAEETPIISDEPESIIAKEAPAEPSDYSRGIIENQNQAEEEAERLATEQQAKEEEERKAAEEAARAEEERRAREEVQKAEDDRIAAEQAALDALQEQTPPSEEPAPDTTEESPRYVTAYMSGTGDEITIAADTVVWLPSKGEKFHSRNDCGNMNPDKAMPITAEEAVSRGINACKNCW